MTLKLCDFGSAKELSSTEELSHSIVGLPHYQAPEMIAGNGYSMKINLWSLGLVMYELLTGELPFGVGRRKPKEV